MSLAEVGLVLSVIYVSQIDLFSGKICVSRQGKRCRHFSWTLIIVSGGAVRLRIRFGYLLISVGARLYHIYSKPCGAIDLR